MITTPPAHLELLSQNESDAPKRVSGKFIRIRYNVAQCLQRMPEMSDQEVLLTNEKAGGYAWLDHPSEDIYNQ